MGKKHKSKIGGQALIEGIMMKGVRKTAMACRLPNGTIDIEEWDDDSSNLPFYRKLLFVRGIFNFISSLAVGYKCLMKSAEKQTQEEEKETCAPENTEEVRNPQEIQNPAGEQNKDEKQSSALFSVLMVIALVIGVAVGILLFTYLPTKVVSLLSGFISNNILKTVIEGLIKIVIFVIYLAVTSLMSDIKRTYEYHGAEHKTIACFEGGEELTIENVKKYPRFHPRCGTSFIFLVLLINIFISSFISWNNLLIRVGMHLLILPLVVGISYEIIRIAGRYTENIAAKIISAPGLFLQRLTTREPDDSEIEVAIAAIMPCLPENLQEDSW